MQDHDAASETPDGGVGRQWLTLALGLLAILLAVEQLVGSVERLTRTLGIPPFLAGVTILAAATSLPDAMVSVRTARSGEGATSLGNVLGSNTFDLLVALPLGVLLVGSATIDFAVAAPMMGILTVATILLFTVLRTDLSLTSREAVVILTAYGLFVAWVVTETLGVTNSIRGI